MVLRFVTRRHSASIATGTPLLALTPPAGGDIRGNPRYLVAIRVAAGADMQRIFVSSPDWGARQLQVPPKGQGGGIAGLRTHFLEHPQLVNINQEVNVSATQDSAGAQTETVDLLYLEGTIPAAILATVAKLHDMFLSGTATSGAFPSAPSAAQRMQQVAASVWSPIAIAHVGADADSNVQITFPEADGQGPQVAGNSDVLEEFQYQETPPMQVVNNGDTIDVFAQDTSGSAFQTWIRFVMLENGQVPLNRYTPMFGNKN